MEAVVAADRESKAAAWVSCTRAGAVRLTSALEIRLLSYRMLRPSPEGLPDGGGGPEGPRWTDGRKLEDWESKGGPASREGVQGLVEETSDMVRVGGEPRQKMDWV